jgi:hypothetical protein
MTPGATPGTATSEWPDQEARLAGISSEASQL